MPKVVDHKVTTIRGTPVDNVIRVKISNRTRTKKGRATSTNVKTILNDLKPIPTPLPYLLDLYTEDPLSDNEHEAPPNPGVRKGPSKAVSVHYHPIPSSDAC